MSQVRFSIAAGILSVIGIAILFVLGRVLVQIAQPPEPPLHYTQAEYKAEKAVYAPGESMVYSPTLIVARAGRIDVLRSFWSRTKDANATLCSGVSAPTISVSRNFPASVVGNVRGGARVQLLIPPLPPGDYWLLSTATGANGGQGVYQVPFRVERAC